MQSELLAADPDLLLERMRSGDRAAAAEFIERFGTRIRRRVRGKLGPAMRRLFDTQEILSTLGRRLDQFILAGRLRAETAPELWSLVFRIADNALVEKSRVFRSLEAKEGEDSPLAYRMLGRLREADGHSPDGPEIELERALGILEPGIDREILSLWLTGHQHNHIAESLGLAPTAVRKRWQKIRERLREFYEGTENH